MSAICLVGQALVITKHGYKTINMGRHVYDPKMYRNANTQHQHVVVEAQPFITATHARLV